MNGIHDMGGMHGFGPVIHEREESPFHQEWEERVHALTYAVVLGHFFNADQFRDGIERMPPAAYLRASYFERWLATVEYNLVRGGFLTAGDVDARIQQRREDPAHECLANQEPPSSLPVAPPAPSLPPPDPPRFGVGDEVQVSNIHPCNHTRLPRYVRGKRGVVIIMPGPAVFPDDRAQGVGARQLYVYTVRFDARELWGDSAEPRQTVSIDIWEPYLEAA